MRRLRHCAGGLGMILLCGALVTGCAGVEKKADRQPLEGKDIDCLRLLDANGTEVAEALQKVLKVEAYCVKSSNTVVVAGSKEDVQLARNLVASLGSSHGEFPPAVIVYHLKNARAGELSAMLNEAFSKGLIRYDEVHVAEVHVFADDRTNSLLISVQARYWDQIKEIIDKLDGPVEGAATKPAGK